MSDAISLDDPFIRGLACAALHPGLRAILIFDATPAKLRSWAAMLRQMIEVVEGAPVGSAAFGTTETDDVLWGSLTLPQEPDSPPFVWQTGLLTGGRDGEGEQGHVKQQVVVIPDLTHLSLAAARACVMAIDAPVVHLERHGQHTHWQPRICWLAGCASDQVGQVSPHLLDRFVLRLRAPDIKWDKANRVDRLRRWVSMPTPARSPEPLPSDLVQALQEATQHRPLMTDEAVAHALTYLPATGPHSLRREIALGRLSTANAMLKDAAEVEVRHVNTAAVIIGLRRPEQSDRSKETPEPAPPEPAPSKPATDPSRAPKPVTGETPVVSSSSADDKAIVHEPDDQQEFPSSPLPVGPATAYPEDDAPIEREVASLRLPLRHPSRVVAARGPVVGVGRATHLHDLALVSTLFEAIKFQPVRRQRTGTAGNRLLINSADLRRYIRAPVPEKMLVLVLDCTCLRDRQWGAALSPHLRWAYVERASICLVRVGAANARHELRAERLLAHNVLVPQFDAALKADPGRATPLAHGLDLALQTLRHALQHGAAPVLHARLVVLSDGRGNVPLAASRAGEIAGPVGRQGIDDALQVAAHIQGLDRVKAVFLDPQPQQYADLPKQIAIALGATWEKVELVLNRVRRTSDAA